MRAGLAKVAIEVEHQRNRPGIGLLGLERRHVVIHLVGDLRFGLEALWRYASGSRNDQRRALDIKTRKLGKIDNHGIDSHGGAAAHSIASHGANAPTHYLPEGAVFVIA